MAILQYKDGDEWKKYVPAVDSGGTGADNVIDAMNNLRGFFGYPVNNVTGGEANDTNEFWANKPQGIYYFSQANMLKNQPGTYGHLLNIKHGWNASLGSQIFVQYSARNSDNGNNCIRLYHRSFNINSSNNVLTDWENEALTSYPVGAVYISYTSTSPASLFGGNWTQITSGVLRAANGNGTGGSDSAAITEAQLPKMTLATDMRGASDSFLTYAAGSHSNLQYFPVNKSCYRVAGNTSSLTSGSAGVAFDFGGGSSRSNLPAYQNLYVWRRTG